MLMIINQKENTLSEGQARGAAGDVAVNYFGKIVQRSGVRCNENVEFTNFTLNYRRRLFIGRYFRTKFSFLFPLPAPLVFGLVFTTRLFTLSICGVSFYDVYFSPAHLWTNKGHRAFSFGDFLNVRRRFNFAGELCT